MGKSEQLIKTIDIIMNKSVDYYRNVFNTFYPAFGGNGLTERNQSFNFCRHYMDIVKDAVVWQELPIKYKTDNKEVKGHIDSLIIDKTNKIILLIEAKRITKGRVDSKVESIAADFGRLIDNPRYPYQERDPWRTSTLDYENYATYILLLTDIWCSNKKNDKRRKLIDNWNSTDYIQHSRVSILAKKYEVGAPNENEKYHIAYRLYSKP